MPRNLLFWIFASFLILLLTPFISKPEYLKDLTLFLISFISSSKIINVVPDPKIFFGIAASFADATDVNPKGTKTLLANGLSTFLIKSKPGFINGPRNVLKSPPNYTIWDSWVFDSLILTVEPFAKALRISETCVLGNNNLPGKLVSASKSLITCDERFKVTWVPFFIPYFNLFSCKLDNFTFKAILYSIKAK